MAHSSTWPPLLLGRLTELADLQDFDHLWVKLLRCAISPGCQRETQPGSDCESLWFPPSSSFKIKAAKDSNTFGHYFIVYHESRSSPCFLLTWHPTTKHCCKHPYRHFVSEAKRFGRRVHRIHAIGTRISSYEIEPFATRHDGRLVYRPALLPGYVACQYDMADVDILEPLGYQRFAARIEMAWVRAGVPWSAPDLNLPTSESFHRLVPVLVADSHCRVPFISVPGSSSSDGVAVQSCGREDVASFTSFHKFPVEIVLEILGYISSSDLRNFALSSVFYNDLASRRLWRKFVIAGNSTEEAAERCNALLRLPMRARRLHSLIIGPAQWIWSSDLLRSFQQIWPTLPGLVDLTFNNPHVGLGNHCMARSRRSLEPLIRGLLPHARSFHLRSFTYGGWMWPQSPLHRFLCAQPSIEELNGVDFFATRPLPRSPQFLPSLRALGCLRIGTALFFLPNRGIHKLSISDIMCDSDLNLLAEALEASDSTLDRLCLSVLEWPPPNQLGPFAKLFSQVRKLILGGYGDFSIPFPFALPALEELECMQTMRGYEADPARLAIFASHFGPKLRRAYFYARGERHTWLKEEGTESQFYLATGPVPEPKIVYA